MSSPEDIFKLPEGSDDVFSGDLKKKKGKKKDSGVGDIFSMASEGKKKKGKDDPFGGIGL